MQNSQRQDFEPLKVAVAQICTNRAHVRLLLDQAELALEDCKKALEASSDMCEGSLKCEVIQ